MPLSSSAFLTPLLSYYNYYGNSYQTGGYRGGFTFTFILIGTFALSLLARLLLRSTYARYSQMAASSGMTGAEVAQRILDANGIRDVSLSVVSGTLTDHYDPRTKTLNLSQENYSGRSVAALGVAAHECGHAIQDQQHYTPLQWRMAAVGITNFASSVVFWIPLLGIFLHMISIHLSITIMAVAWGVLMLFQLVTLPVEFDATARAKRILPQLGAVAPGAEMAGMKRVLDVAALTYVAAFISTLAYFLYYLMRLQGNSRN